MPESVRQQQVYTESREIYPIVLQIQASLDTILEQGDFTESKIKIPFPNLPPQLSKKQHQLLNPPNLKVRRGRRSALNKQPTLFL